MADLPEVNESNFQAEVLDCAQPVLVDFWAPWCGPCRAIAPVVAELAEDNSGTAKVVKLNVDESPALAAKYGVTNIPTLMVFRGGQVVNSFMGIQPKARLQEALDQAKSMG